MDERFLYKRSKILREYISSFHLCIMFIGLAITSIGAYFINSNTSKTLAIALLAIGGFITVISFVGCFGAQLENTGFLNTYSSIMAILFILELAGVTLAYTHKFKLYEYGSQSWNFFYENDSKFLMDIEKTFNCCGYDSNNDRAIPKNCSIVLNADTGCKESMINHFNQWHEWITAIFVILLVIQLLALVLSVVTSVLLDREEREEETYLTLLSSRLHHESSNHSYNHFTRSYRSSQKSIPRYGSTSS